LRVSSIISVLGVLYLRFVSITSRLRIHTDPAAASLMHDRRPCLFAFWHRYQLMMAWVYRNHGAHVLVSRSQDGDLIAGALHVLGYRTVRGSSSRGGAAALMGLMDILVSGGQAAVTPDGPRGPYRSLQPGLLTLARKTGAPIVPCGWAGSRVKILGSWDRFIVPLPFGRYDVVFGAPISVPEEGGEDLVREALDGAAAEADALLRGDPK
jgi:lysophospholipid acyltransferase (LPLAT)-like uncharacterized protein